MKKSILPLFFALLAFSCEALLEEEEVQYPDEPMCWVCNFSTLDESWQETFCDLTYDDILYYEDQVYYESGGEISVDCY